MEPLFRLSPHSPGAIVPKKAYGYTSLSLPAVLRGLQKAALDGLAAAPGMGTDSWHRKYTAAIEVGGSNGDGIRFAKKVMYDETGKIKVEYEDTGVPLSFEGREKTKAYFESLKAQHVSKLKFDDPNQYLTVLKDIVQHLFPEGVKIGRVTESGLPDHGHFLKERQRREYVHSLTDTLAEHDIKLTFSKAAGEKIVLMKKYFDPDTQKDIYDTVIAFNGDLHTKIVNIGGERQGTMG